LWTKVHKHCLSFGPEQDEITLFKQSRSTCSSAVLTSTISWLFSGNYFKPLAYGVPTVKDSQQKKHILSSYICLSSKKQMCRDYYFSFPSKRMPINLFYNLISIFGKKNDNYWQHWILFHVGTDGTFTRLQGFICRVVFNENKRSFLLSLVSSIQMFLKKNYKKHLSEISPETCANLPFIFGEQDLQERKLCTNCASIVLMFATIKNLINDLTPDEIKLYLQPNSKDDLQ
jgi:hypothetical protein